MLKSINISNRRKVIFEKHNKKIAISNFISDQVDGAYQQILNTNYNIYLNQVFFIKKGKCMFHTEYNTNINVLYICIRYDGLWKICETHFGLNWEETQKVFSKILLPILKFEENCVFVARDIEYKGILDHQLKLDRRRKMLKKIFQKFRFFFNPSK